MRAPLIFSFALGASALLSLALVPAAPSYAQSGQQAFSRCAACHLPTGAGVPGSYPSLQKDARILARSPVGRRYMVQVVTKGLSGPITVDGKAFRGTMPMQGGMSDAAVAGVLTYVTGTIAKGGAAPKPFTAAEVAAARAAAASMNPAAIAKSRPAAR